MIITVYGLDGWIVDTPSAYINRDNKKVYSNISAMGVHVDGVFSAKFVMPISRDGRQMKMCEETQLQCRDCAKKIHTFFREKTLENWGAMNRAVRECREDDVTLEDFEMPREPMKVPVILNPQRANNSFDETAAPRHLKIPFAPPKLHPGT